MTLKEAQKRYKSWTRGVLTEDARKDLDCGTWRVVNDIPCLLGSNYGLAFVPDGVAHDIKVCDCEHCLNVYGK